MKKAGAIVLAALMSGCIPVDNTIEFPGNPDRFYRSAYEHLIDDNNTERYSLVSLFRHEMDKKETDLPGVALALSTYSRSICPPIVDSNVRLFVSGCPEMQEALEQYLNALGVEPSDVVYDGLDGTIDLGEDGKITFENFIIHRNIELRSSQTVGIADSEASDNIASLYEIISATELTTGPIVEKNNSQLFQVDSVSGTIEFYLSDGSEQFNDVIDLNVKINGESVSTNPKGKYNILSNRADYLQIETSGTSSEGVNFSSSTVISLR